LKSIVLKKSKPNNAGGGEGKYSGFGLAYIPGFFPVYSGNFSKGIVWTQIPIHFLKSKYKCSKMA
jgi:hypothetical protein